MGVNTSIANRRCESRYVVGNIAEHNAAVPGLHNVGFTADGIFRFTAYNNAELHLRVGMLGNYGTSRNVPIGCHNIIIIGKKPFG
jgi:hypothetical protein